MYRVNAYSPVHGEHLNEVTPRLQDASECLLISPPSLPSKRCPTPTTLILTAQIARICRRQLDTHTKSTTANLANLIHSFISYTCCLLSSDLGQDHLTYISFSVCTHARMYTRTHRGKYQRDCFVNVISARKMYSPGP